MATRIRKNAFAGRNNRAKPRGQHPLLIVLSGNVRAMILRSEGKNGGVQPIFFSQEIFVRHSKIKFRFLLVGFSRRF